MFGSKVGASDKRVQQNAGTCPKALQFGIFINYYGGDQINGKFGGLGHKRMTTFGQKTQMEQQPTLKSFH
jgi:hypothetical protein